MKVLTPTETNVKVIGWTDFLKDTLWYFGDKTVSCHGTGGRLASDGENE